MLNRLLVLTILGGLLPLGAMHWWVFELTSHFRLQYLAVAALMLVLALLFRRRRLTLLLVATMAVNAWPVRAYLPITATATATASRSDDTLTILNFNVNAGNGNHDEILATVRAADADVVALIELSPALEAKLGELGELYPYDFLLPANDNFGIGLLSRYPIAYAEPTALGPSNAITADILHPGGRFRLIAVHPKPPTSAANAGTRNEQLRQLAARVRETDGPLVVCGDFNVSPYSPWFGQFEANSGMRDVRRGHWPDISWPSFMPVLGTPIDHCFASGDFAVETVERLGRTSSDHYPMRVQLGW